MYEYVASLMRLWNSDDELKTTNGLAAVGLLAYICKGGAPAESKPGKVQTTHLSKCVLKLEIWNYASLALV